MVTNDNNVRRMKLFHQWQTGGEAEKKGMKKKIPQITDTAGF